MGIRIPTQLVFLCVVSDKSQRDTYDDDDDEKCESTQAWNLIVRSTETKSYPYSTFGRNQIVPL